MIKDPHRWNIGAARLRGFTTNLPTWPHEKHIEEYHSILDDFASSCDSDFSSFKIPDFALSLQQKSSYSYFEPRQDQRKYCDTTIFKTKVSGLLYFVIGIAKDTHPPKPDPLPTKAPDMKELTSQIFINEMHGSQIVQNSPAARISNKGGLPAQDFANLIVGIKSLLQTSQVDEQTKEQIKVDIGTIEIQIHSAKPNPSIVRESLKSLKTILENAAGSALASTLLPSIHQLLSKLM